MSERDEAVTEIAEVLASWCSKSGDDMSHLLCGELVHRQHREQAEALMPWLAERDRRTEAKALRAAADDEDFAATCDHLPWVRLGGHCQCGYLRALAADGKEGQW